MNDNVVPAGMGLTERQRLALKGIVAHVGRHGVMPSRRMLAAALGCNSTNANRLMHRLIERGELCTGTPGGALIGFGSSGVAVCVPEHIAAAMASYCAEHDERLVSFVADAILLHLDSLGGDVT